MVYLQIEWEKCKSYIVTYSQLGVSILVKSLNSAMIRSIINK